MDIRVISTTKPNNTTSTEEFELFSGHCAGVCYMADTFDSLLSEDIEKTQKRAQQTMINGHHIVFDHDYITLYIENIPKLLAMFLNNEKMYTTSEKSARYTQMTNLSSLEEKKYRKWYLTFEYQINHEYPEISAFKRKKLAMENARYMISIFTPTCMVYTTTYRQLNYIYQWLENIKDITKFGEIFNKPSITAQWQTFINDFQTQLLKTNYINPELKDYKNRTFSLFGTKEQVMLKEEILQDVYSIYYTGSFAQLAQAQRHRTLNYTIYVPDSITQPLIPYFVPALLSPSLAVEWLKDCEELYKNDIISQARLIYIKEQGTYQNFILKCKERLCSAAQYEIAIQTQQTLDKYITTISKQPEHWIWKDIQQYNTGKARCSFPDFVCPNPCGFNAGINMKRLI